MNRRVAWVGILSLAGIFLCGCEGRGKSSNGSDATTGKLVVVLLDRSGSVKNDRGIYERALTTIVSSVNDGDRFVMGSITSASGTDFGASVDYTLPPPMAEQSWLDEPIKYKREFEARQKELAGIRESLAKDVTAFLDEERDAARTAIFESLRVVEPLFHAERRRKVLVILSDMLEDSGVANFDRGRLPPEIVQSVIDDQRSKGTLPELTGVNVYVAGAVASPPERSAAVQRFWIEYFEAAGATIDKGKYARILVSFEE